MTVNGDEVNGIIELINDKNITVKLNKGGISRKINSNNPEQMTKLIF